MKKNYLPILFSFLLGSHQGMSQQRVDAYSFPVRPGSEAWKQFTTGQAMVDACQIPAATLHSMSTKALIATCLSYPLLSTLFAHNDLQTGFQALAATFNGIPELLQREDAGRELVKVYRLMDPNAVLAQEAGRQRGAFTFSFTYMEMLLAQPTLLEKLTNAERKDLTKESFAKLKSKDVHFDYYGGLGELTSALVLGRVLEKDRFSEAYQVGKRSSAMQTFLVTGQVQDTKIINQVVADAQTFIK